MVREEAGGKKKRRHKNKREVKKKRMKKRKASGGDTIRGNTRKHLEHESEGLIGRWYYAGDGMGKQVAARFNKKR